MSLIRKILIGLLYVAFTSGAGADMREEISTVENYMPSGKKAVKGPRESCLHPVEVDIEVGQKNLLKKGMAYSKVVTWLYLIYEAHKKNYKSKGIKI